MSFVCCVCVCCFSQSHMCLCLLTIPFTYACVAELLIRVRSRSASLPCVLACPDIELVKRHWSLICDWKSIIFAKKIGSYRRPSLRDRFWDDEFHRPKIDFCRFQKIVFEIYRRIDPVRRLFRRFLKRSIPIKNRIKIVLDRKKSKIDPGRSPIGSLSTHVHNSILWYNTTV